MRYRDLTWEVVESYYSNDTENIKLFIGIEIGTVPSGDDTDDLHNWAVACAGAVPDMLAAIDHLTTEKRASDSLDLLAGLDVGGVPRLFLRSGYMAGAMTHAEWVKVLDQLGAAPGEMLSVSLALDDGPAD